MKLFLILLILLIASNYGAKCQSSDTLCFPVPAIQKILIAAKQKQAADSLVSIYRSDISILNQSIRAYQVKDSISKEIDNTRLSMIQTMKDQRSVLEGQISYLDKQVTKWKRKTKWAAFGGLLLTGIVTSLFIFK